MTYCELRDWVVDDVEGVGTQEIQCNLNDQRRGIDHPRLDDQGQQPAIFRARLSNTRAEFKQ